MTDYTCTGTVGNRRYTSSPGPFPQRLSKWRLDWKGWVMWYKSPKILGENCYFLLHLSLKAAKYEIQNLQLVAQHCFVASFRRCFPFFTLRDQLVAQQKHLLRVKLITQGEKRETSTKTCNETMLRDKLKVFVSRISPP